MYIFLRVHSVFFDIYFWQLRSGRAITSPCALTIVVAAVFRCVVLTLPRIVSLLPKSLMSRDVSLNITSIHSLEGPEPLKGPYDPVGYPVGCQTACEAGLSPDPRNSKNCCTGSYNTPATCNSSNVEFYSYFSEFLPAPFLSSLTTARHVRIKLPEYIRVSF